MVHRILVALLLIGSAARAQAAFGSRGQVVPFGGIGYSHTSVGNADANSISLARRNVAQRNVFRFVLGIDQHGMTLVERRAP